MFLAANFQNQVDTQFFVPRSPLPQCSGRTAIISGMMACSQEKTNKNQEFQRYNSVELTAAPSQKETI